MNELSRLFSDISDGQTVILEKGRVYDVRQDDSFIKTGFFCSNSAKQDENPDGRRYSAVFLENKKNIIIDGNGAVILVHGKMTPLLFYNCENITVKNLEIDYAVPTMTEFTVIENDGGVITVKINPDCPYSVAGNTLYWCGENGLDGKPYWENACNAPKRYIKVFDPISETTRDFRREDLTFSDIEIIGENLLKCTLENKDVCVNNGDIFQTRNIIRDQVGSMFERSKNLTFENLRVKFMHGLGMVSQFCENVTFRNCDFTPKEGRTIASTADFFQFSGCKGKIIIDGCKARGAQDDFVNVHGTHLRIISADFLTKSIIVRFMHPETWGFQAFEEGDIIEFIKWDTLIPYDKAKVLSFERIDNTDIRLFVDFIPSDVLTGKDVIENITCTPDLYVKNCEFGPTSGRGILATTRGEVVIENNSFTKLWGPALLIEDDCNFWYESGYTENIIFRNNVVSSCNFGHTWEGAPVIQVTPKVMREDSEEFVHGRIEIANNCFRDTLWGSHAFVLEYIKDVIIKDNFFDAKPLILRKKVDSLLLKNEMYEGETK